MSWYDYDWSYRAPILLDNLVAATAAIDVVIDIPKIWSEFWDNIQNSSGDDIRVCDADGITLLTFDLANNGGGGAFDGSANDGRIEIDNFSPSKQNAMHVVWLYWGATGKASGVTTFAPASARNGYVTPYLPDGSALRWTRPDPGKQTPPNRLAITTAEVLQPWIVVTGALWDLTETYQGRQDGEELDTIAEEVLQSGVDDSNRYDETKLRMTGRGAIMAHIDGTAMSDDNDYTLSLTIETTAGRTLNPRVLVQAQDVDEA